MAKLVVREGHDAGEEYVLKGDRLVMGRRSQCPIPIADVKASRDHAALIETDDGWHLQDLSRNGTLLNGHLAPKDPPGTALKFGDVIQIGDTVFELVDEKAEPLNVEIPGYKIYEKIGAGGMGSVFKARQLSMDRIVALKVLNERYSSNAEFVDRFIREARAAGKLNHPNVIHVHDISRANGRHYFSMEHVDGQSVKELLRKKKKLDTNAALDIVLQAARALEFAHENGIVHRDIKPENIMLTKEGIVKLADLGIAKTFDEQPASQQASKGVIRALGTPHYMAPEQALGKPIDHRVDIYALGATFYQMVTGSTPFSGANAQEILKAHVNASLPAIQDLNPNVPEPVCFIIERMMAKLPEKRYPDMARLIEDIERVQTGAVKGIERVAADESSVQRAVGKPRSVRASSISDADETGVVVAVAKQSIRPLVLAGIFLITAVAAWKYAPKQESESHASANATPPETHGTEPAPPKNVPKSDDPAPTQAQGENKRSNAEAQKLLDAAMVALSTNSVAEGKDYLTAIRERYPASSQAEEAAKRLDEIAKEELTREQHAAVAMLADAQAYEIAHPNNGDDAVAKYKLAVDGAAKFQSVQDEAKAALAKLEGRLAAERSKAVAAALKEASDKAAPALAAFDFDTARAAYQGFLDAFKTAPQADGVVATLAKVNADAEARFKAAEDAAAKADAPETIHLWKNYVASTKDADKTKDAADALKAAEGKLEQLAQAELTKAADLAKKDEYVEALMVVKGTQNKFAGTSWAEAAKAKEEALHREKDLYEKCLALLDERLANGPLPLPFPLTTPFGEVRWALTKLRGEEFALDAVPQNSAPGLTKRLSDLDPHEQYLLCKLLLPKDLTSELHKNMAAFCAERGLMAEAKLHEQKALAAPVVPLGN